MSTVAEIENALARLPAADWVELRQWMEAHSPASKIEPPLALFRRLQSEVALTPESATAWKEAVAEARP